MSRTAADKAAVRVSKEHCSIKTHCSTAVPNTRVYKVHQISSTILPIHVTRRTQRQQSNNTSFKQAHLNRVQGEQATNGKWQVANPVEATLFNTHGVSPDKILLRATTSEHSRSVRRQKPLLAQKHSKSHHRNLRKERVSAGRKCLLSPRRF